MCLAAGQNLLPWGCSRLQYPHRLYLIASIVADFDSCNSQGGFFEREDLYCFLKRQICSLIIQFQFGGTVSTRESNLISYCLFMELLWELGFISPFSDLTVFTRGSRLCYGALFKCNQIFISTLTGGLLLVK